MMNTVVAVKLMNPGTERVSWGLLKIGLLGGGMSVGPFGLDSRRTSMTLKEKSEELLDTYPNEETLLRVANEAGVVHEGSWLLAARGLAAVLLSCDD